MHPAFAGEHASRESAVPLIRIKARDSEDLISRADRKRSYGMLLRGRTTELLLKTRVTT